MERFGSEAPGPGAYDTAVARTGPAFSLSSRSPTKLSSDSPGPAAYDKSSSLGSSPAFSVSVTFHLILWMSLTLPRCHQEHLPRLRVLFPGQGPTPSPPRWARGHRSLCLAELKSLSTQIPQDLARIQATPQLIHLTSPHFIYMLCSHMNVRNSQSTTNTSVREGVLLLNHPPTVPISYCLLICSLSLEDIHMNMRSETRQRSAWVEELR